MIARADCAKTIQEEMKMRESKFKNYDALAADADRAGGRRSAGNLQSGGLRVGSFVRIPSHQNRHTDSCSKRQVYPVD